MDLVRGKTAEEAKRILKFDRTKAGEIILKTLNSAVANATTNHNLKENDLYVTDLRADGGPVYKRGRAQPKGRYHPIIKRTSHIVVGLAEKEGKN